MFKYKIGVILSKEKKISKFCNDNNFSTKKFISLLLEEGIFKQTDEINEYTGKYKFEVSNTFHYFGRYALDDNGDVYLIINEKRMLNYLKQNEFMEMVQIKEEEKYFTHLRDNLIKKERFLKIKNSKILFLDFESRNQLYSELGLILMINGKMIKEEYYIDSNVMKTEKYKKKYEKSKRLKVETTIDSKDKLNKKLLKYIEEVDIVIGHNVNSEKKILEKEGFDITDIEFICTEKFIEGFIDFHLEKNVKSPNLIELAEFFKLKIERSFVHNAFYDALITKQVTEKLWKVIEHTDYEKFPLSYNIKVNNKKSLSRKEKLEKVKVRKEIKKEYKKSL